ncbi:MAG: NUDIX hydrolase [Syntrophales bacterium]
MDPAPIGSGNNRERAFLWLAPFAPPKGWRTVPPGGMCLCAFLFVLRGEQVLLGRYADHPAWETIAGMLGERVRANAGGWTIPASHLLFGEDPRAAARRIGREILGIETDLAVGEPAVATFFYEPAAAPGERHFDVAFLFEASLAADAAVPPPPWYEALAWFDIGALGSLSFARQHGDVVQAWLAKRECASDRPGTPLSG